MKVQTVLRRLLPPAISERLGLVKRSMVPNQAWTNWGLRRDPKLQSEEAYEKVGWVYGSVKAIARNAQQVPIYGAKQVRGRNGRVDRLPDTHALSQLLNRPNEEEDLPGLIESTITHLKLRGEAFWELDGVLSGADGNPRPGFLYSRPPQWIWKVDILNDKYAAFHMRVPTLGMEVIVPGNQALFFKYYNPRDPWRGLAPMSAAYQAADTYYAAALLNARFFENGALPSMALRYDKNSQVEGLNQDTRDRLRAEIMRLYSGFQNAHNVAVLGPGENLEEIGSGLKDMNFGKLMGMCKDEILAVFGVPPIELGFVESANRANSADQRRLFWEEIVIPDIEDIVSLMNRKLAPRFGPGIICVPDYSQVPALRKDMKALSDGVIPFVEAGGLTINEVRADYLDKQPVEWGDEYWHPSLNIPTGDDTFIAPPQHVAPPQPPGGQQSPPAENDAPQKLNPAMVRKVVLEWKNATLSRIRDGSGRTPLSAFPPGHEAKKATRHYGMPRQAAWQLAHAVHIELSVMWDTNYPESGAANYFERTLERIPVSASGSEGESTIGENL